MNTLSLPTSTKLTILSVSLTMAYVKNILIKTRLPKIGFWLALVMGFQLLCTIEAFDYISVIRMSEVLELLVPKVLSGFGICCWFAWIII
jgi:hypothetical protein